MKRRQMKRFAAALLTGIMMLSFAACESNTTNEKEPSQGTEKSHVKIGLCQQNMLDGTPKVLREKFPDVDFEFIVTNNSADYNVYLYEHDDLPDILTIRRFSLNDAVELKDTLVDLQSTDIAAGYYQNYLQNFTYEDGTVNWLPAVAEVWGIVANKTLFDEYGIDIPTDYSSFVAVCQAFKAQGIKGFETDWSYDYSSLETLEGFNIDLLQSLDGKRWRSSYESGKTTEADEALWSEAFKTMYQVLQDTENLDTIDADDTDIDSADTNATDTDSANTNATSTDSTDAADSTVDQVSLIEIGYGMEKEAFENGSVAMIRASGADIVGYTNNSENEYVMLPYFGQNGNWLLTYPYYSAAINKNSDVDADLLIEIYTFMLGQECQDTLDTGEYMLSYTTDVKVEANALLENLNSYIEDNKVFVRLANNAMFVASKKAVQGMITGEYDAESAYEAFRDTLKEKEEDVVYDYEVEKGYEYDYVEGKGSEAVSAILNSAREVWGTDLAVTYAPCYSNSIYEGKASSSQISYYLSSNPPADYYLELTGEEIETLVSTMLHIDADGYGMYGGMSPVTDDMLPVSSGFEMQVKRTDDGYELESLTIDGEKINQTKTYSICFNIPSYYASYIAEAASITLPEGSNEVLLGIKDTLTQYLITDEKQFMEPTEYITVGN